MPDSVDSPAALLVTSSFLPGRGGIESYLAQLCDELRPRLAVFAPARRDAEPLPHDLGYPVRGYSGSLLIPRRKVAAAITATAADLGTDRILLGTPWPLVLLGPALARAGLRYSVIVHGAELLVPAAIPLLRARVARCLAGADLLLAVSEFTAGRIRSLLATKERDAPRVDLLRARVDLNRWHPGAPDGIVDRLGVRGRPAVLMFGRLVRRKGAHRLVSSMGEIARRVPGAVLIVAGTGPEERALRRLASRAGAPVIFTGRVAEADAPGLCAYARVLALPVADRWWGLEAEGLGVVLLEAGASGTASVSGRSGGTPEAVVDGVTGYLIDARDESVLVNRVVTLLTDRGQAEAMGQAGREHVRTEFSERPLPASLLRWLGYHVR